MLYLLPFSNAQLLLLFCDTVWMVRTVPKWILFNLAAYSVAVPTAQVLAVPLALTVLLLTTTCVVWMKYQLGYFDVLRAYFSFCQIYKVIVWRKKIFRNMSKTLMDLCTRVEKSKGHSLKLFSKPKVWNYHCQNLVFYTLSFSSHALGKHWAASSLVLKTSSLKNSGKS